MAEVLRKNERIILFDFLGSTDSNEYHLQKNMKHYQRYFFNLKQNFFFNSGKFLT